MHDGHSYILGMSAMLAPEEQTSDLCEWRIAVERKRSLKEKLKSTGRIEQNDPVFQSVLSTCKSQPDFTDFRIE